MQQTRQYGLAVKRTAISLLLAVLAVCLMVPEAFGAETGSYTGGTELRLKLNPDMSGGGETGSYTGGTELRLKLNPDMSGGGETGSYTGGTELRLKLAPTELVPKVYKITLTDNGGSGSSPSTFYVKKGNGFYSDEACTTAITSITKPTKAQTAQYSYTYAGHKSGDTTYINSAGVIQDSLKNITADTALTAAWTQKARSYTVTYNMNGHGTAPTTSTSYTYGVGLTSLPTPAAVAGYTFGGWYKEAACTNKVTSISTTDTGNKTFYAKWTIKSFNITLSYGASISSVSATYTGMSGSWTSGAKSVPYGTVITLSATAAANYNTPSWTKSSGSGTLSGTSFTVGDGTATLTASATPNVYTVTLDSALYESSTAATGTVTASKGTTAYYEKYATGKYTTSACTTAISKITVPTRTNYKFGGYWSTKTGTGTMYIDANGNFTSSCTNSVFTKNTTLYARWYVTVTLEQKLYNGSNSTSPGDNPTTSGTSTAYAVYGAGIYTSATGETAIRVPTRSGYSFGGYWTTRTGTGYQRVDADGALTSATGITANATLYARWAVKVTLDSRLYDGSTSTTPATAATSAGTTEVYQVYGAGWYPSLNASNKVTAITVPTRDNYQFAGYWATKTGTGARRVDATDASLPSSTTTFTQSTTWYARWSVKVTLDAKRYSSASDGTGNAATSAGTTSLYQAYGAGWYSSLQGATVTTAITAPALTGYTWGGYWTSKTGTGTKHIDTDKKLPAATTFTQATTLYAKWTADTYTITLDKDGGKNGTSTVTATYDAVPGNIAAPTRDGCAFAGYYGAKYGKETQFYGYDSTDKKWKWTQGAWNRVSDLTLYAKWMVTVDFDTDTYGGSAAVASRTYVVGVAYNDDVNGDAKGLPSASKTTGTYEGWAGWYTATTGGIAHIDKTTVTAGGADAAKTLVACWNVRATYQNPGGGSWAIKDASDNVVSYKTVTQGQAYGALATPTRAGYTAASNPWKIGDTTITSTSKVTQKANHTLALASSAAKADITVRYYRQNIGGSGYTEVTDDKRTVNLTTESTVSVDGYKNTYTGFTYETFKLSNSDYDNAVPGAALASDKVAGNGTTLLQIYYTRDTYSVTVENFTVRVGDADSVRATAKAALANAGNAVSGSASTVDTATTTRTMTVWYGDTVNLSAVVPGDDNGQHGYTFKEWTLSGVANSGTEAADVSSSLLTKGAAVNANSFKMPAASVTVRPQATAQATQIKVEHWQMKVTGGSITDPANYERVDADTQWVDATVDADATKLWTAKTYTGFTFVGDPRQYTNSYKDPATASASPFVFADARVAPDSTTTVRLYYKRDVHELTLTAGTRMQAAWLSAYNLSDKDAGGNAKRLAPKTTGGTVYDVYYGANIQVQAHIAGDAQRASYEVTGYASSEPGAWPQGWPAQSLLDNGNVDTDGLGPDATFAARQMPERSVELTVNAQPVRTTYEVHHLFQTLDSDKQTPTDAYVEGYTDVYGTWQSPAASTISFVGPDGRPLTDVEAAAVEDAKLVRVHGGTDALARQLKVNGFTVNEARTNASNVTSSDDGGLIADALDAPYGTYGPSDEPHKLTKKHNVAYVFYDRNPYTLSFEFTGKTQNGRSPVEGNLPPEARTYYFGATANLSEVADVPDETGYTCERWYRGGSTVSEIVMPYYNVKLTGEWKAKVYTLAYDGNVAEGAANPVKAESLPPSATVTYDTAYRLAASEPVRNGYAFLGWSWNAGDAVNTFDAGADMGRWDWYETPVGSTAEGARTRTIYAQWEPVAWKVDVDYDGGTIAPGERALIGYTTGSRDIVVPGAVKEGYELDRWEWDFAPGSSGDDCDDCEPARLAYDDAAGQWVLSKDAFGDLKLRAVWKGRTYTVELNPAGGTLRCASPVSVTYGAAIGEALWAQIAGDDTAPVRSGWEFDGWWDETVEPAVRMSAESIYGTDDDSVWTAHWKPGKFNISYQNLDAAGAAITDTAKFGSFAVDAQGAFALPTQSDLSFDDANKDKWLLYGWHDVTDLPEGADEAAKKAAPIVASFLPSKATGDKTFWAEWRAKDDGNTTFTVRYFLESLTDDGSTISGPNGLHYLEQIDMKQTFPGNEGDDADFPIPNFPGYKDAVVMANGTPVAPGDPVTVLPWGDLVLSLYYQRAGYAITVVDEDIEGVVAGYSSVSGDHGLDDGTYKYGSTVTVSVRVEEGWELAGWNAVAEDGYAVPDAIVPVDGTSATFEVPAGAVKVEPVMRRMQYPIDYNLMGGTGAPGNPARYSVDGGDIVIDPPTKAAWDFMGWTVTGWAGTADERTLSMSEYAFDPDTMVTTIPQGYWGRLSLKANWELHTYYITYDEETVAAWRAGEVTDLTENGEVDGEPAWTYKFNRIVNDKIKNPQRRGYEFKGWTVDPADSAHGLVMNGAGQLEVVRGFTYGDFKLTAQWEAVPYVGTLHLGFAEENGVSWSASEVESVFDGNTVTFVYTTNTKTFALPDPTTTMDIGFVGWSRTKPSDQTIGQDAEGVDLIDAGYIVPPEGLGDIELWAVWNMRKSTVTLMVDEGDGGLGCEDGWQKAFESEGYVDALVEYGGSEYDRLVAAERQGYARGDWYTDAGLGADSLYGSQPPSRYGKEDATYYSAWHRNPVHEVRLSWADNHAGSAVSNEEALGQATYWAWEGVGLRADADDEVLAHNVGKLPVPRAPGYRFAGYADGAGKLVVDAAGAVDTDAVAAMTTDEVLTAQFTRLPRYEVRLVAEGEGVTPGSVETIWWWPEVGYVYTGADDDTTKIVTITGEDGNSAIPEKEGSFFAGWAAAEVAEGVPGTDADGVLWRTTAEGTITADPWRDPCGGAWAEGMLDEGATFEWTVRWTQKEYKMAFTGFDKNRVTGWVDPTKGEHADAFTLHAGSALPDLAALGVEVPKRPGYRLAGLAAEFTDAEGNAQASAYYKVVAGEDDVLAWAYAAPYDADPAWRATQEAQVQPEDDKPGVLTLTAQWELQLVATVPSHVTLALAADKSDVLAPELGAASIKNYTVEPLAVDAVAMKSDEDELAGVLWTDSTGEGDDEVFSLDAGKLGGSGVSVSTGSWDAADSRVKFRLADGLGDGGSVQAIDGDLARYWWATAALPNATSTTAPRIPMLFGFDFDDGVNVLLNAAGVLGRVTFTVSATAS